MTFPEWDAEARKALAYARSKPWGRDARLTSDLCYIVIPSGDHARLDSHVPAEMASVRKFMVAK